jgi:hypothetical protein
MNSEEWREIEGFDGKYLVSNLGRVKSNPGRQEGRVLKPGTQSKGYQTVYLYLPVKPKKAISLSVHRIVMKAFGPPAGRGQAEINHKDMNKKNNCLDNLEWCSSKENHVHAVETGGTWSGESNGKCKLTDEQFVGILTRLAAGESTNTIATEFVLNPGYVREIRRGKYRPKARKMYQQQTKAKEENNEQ